MSRSGKQAVSSSVGSTTCRCYYQLCTCVEAAPVSMSCPSSMSALQASTVDSSSESLISNLSPSFLLTSANFFLQGGGNNTQQADTAVRNA